MTDITIKYDHGQMLIHLDNFLSDRKISEIRKLIKLIRQSYTPECEEQIKEYITNMMKYPDANTLVVRKTYRTLKDSCFTELKWAIHRLGVDAFWDIKESPLEMTYKPTGQKIYFRGLDDPLKVTSITVDQGVLCWMWIEEAYEISSEDDFNMLDESIRGAIPEGSDLFKQITVTFNPCGSRSTICRR